MVATIAACAGCNKISRLSARLCLALQTPIYGVSQFSPPAPAEQLSPGDRHYSARDDSLLLLTTTNVALDIFNLQTSVCFMPQLENKYIIQSIVCEASCHSVTWSLGHSVTWSLGHSVTWLLGHLVTRLSSCHQNLCFTISTNGLTN